MSVGASFPLACDPKLVHHHDGSPFDADVADPMYIACDRRGPPVTWGVENHGTHHSGHSARREAGKGRRWRRRCHGRARSEIADPARMAESGSLGGTVRSVP